MMASTGFSKFQLEALQAHNELRQKHGVPPLTLNKNLNALAQEWAETCIRNNTMSHRPNNNYGENIYWLYTSNVNQQPNVKDAVQNWYDEIKYYTFGTENNSSKTFHFTQVIWKSSTELGVGMASANGQTYVVANYNPPGNFMGAFVPNVPKPIY